MSRNSVLLVWLLVFALLSSSVSAQTASVGILHPRGEVTVNGRPVAASSAVFAGDTVKTGANGYVVITANNLNVALGPNGSLQMENGRLQLGCGSIVAIDANGPVTVGGYTITPGTGRMRIELAQGPQFTVTSRGGAVSVSGAGSLQPVSAGGSSQLSGLPGCDVVPTALSATAPAVAAKSSNAYLWVLLGGAGAAAGVAAAVASGGNNDRAPVSPARP